jgi:probable phosphoglycerate mutase
VTPTHLLLLRHGETEANRARLIQGRDDSPLTPEGVAGTRQVADKLRDLGLDPARTATYCSPLPRARDTLGHVRGHLGVNGPVRYDPRLVEIDFGTLTGRPVDEVLPRILRHKRDTRLPYPDGESGDQLKARVLAFVEDATRAHPGWHVVVMTHFGVIETAVRHFFKVPLSEPVRPPHDAVHHIALAPGAPPRLTVI